jgi:hypothetical protein
LPSADAFRDAKSDIDQIRAGITSPQRVIANNLGTTADAILSETREWAIMVSKTVEDANRELVKQGYKPTVTAADVAQVSDNPQAAAQAENLTQGKPTTISDSSTKSDTVEQTGEAPKPAAMADFEESKHPRAKDGEFGSGGGKASPNEPAGKTGDSAPKSETGGEGKADINPLNDKSNHPKYSLSFVDNVFAAKEGDIIGTLGNFLKGEKTRSVFKEILHYPIVVVNRLIQNGKEIERPDVEFKGASGKLNGKGAIFVSNNEGHTDIVNTILEEAAHQMRTIRGRISKEDIATVDPEAYRESPDEVYAQKIVDYVKAIKESKK